MLQGINNLINNPIQDAISAGAVISAKKLKRKKTNFTPLKGYSFTNSAFSSKPMLPFKQTTLK